MTKDERIALLNADIAAGRIMIPRDLEWGPEYLGEWAWDPAIDGPFRFMGTGARTTQPTGHLISFSADDCVVLADRHEDLGNASLAYHWREMARRKRDEDRT